MSDEKAKQYGWTVYVGKEFPVIGNDVWIGRDVTLAMGIIVGDGAINAAKSDVTKDVPPYSIVGGNHPASIIKFRFSSGLIYRLQSSKWWIFDPQKLSEIGFESPEKFCECLEYKKELGFLISYKPNIVYL